MPTLSYLPNYLIGAFIFVFGLLIGSFLNVVVYRLPLGQSIVFPGSHCPSCETEIKAYDNIPVFSYLILGGRCRHCRILISPIYPMVELLVGGLYLLLFILDGLTAVFLANVVFVSFIVPLFFIDLKHKLLLNVITYPGIVLGFGLRVLAPDGYVIDSTRAIFQIHAWPNWSVSLIGSLFGAVVGGGTFWLIRELYYRVRHVEGMGLGDVKMMLMVGAFLGWQLTVLTMFAASLGGSVIGLLIMGLKRSNLKLEIPFGVFLGPAAIFALLFGESIIRWYIGLLR
ncbi:MAG: prepilin peptidase [Blastocatellia bacterium]